VALAFGAGAAGGGDDVPGVYESADRGALVPVGGDGAQLFAEYAEEVQCEQQGGSEGFAGGLGFQRVGVREAVRTSQRCCMC